MIDDPILLLAEDGRLQDFVRSSSGHTVHHSDVAREGFHCSPEAAEIIVRMLARRTESEAPR